jgi:hypothetical protein
MTILVTRDAAAFADRAWDFLQPRIECNILATVLTAVRAGTLVGREELFACVLDGSGRVRGGSAPHAAAADAVQSARTRRRR